MLLVDLIACVYLLAWYVFYVVCWIARWVACGWFGFAWYVGWFWLEIVFADLCCLVFKLLVLGFFCLGLLVCAGVCVLWILFCWFGFLMLFG